MPKVAHVHRSIPDFMSDSEIFDALQAHGYDPVGMERDEMIHTMREAFFGGAIDPADYLRHLPKELHPVRKKDPRVMNPYVSLPMATGGRLSVSGDDDSGDYQVRLEGDCRQVAIELGDLGKLDLFYLVVSDADTWDAVSISQTGKVKLTNYLGSALLVQGEENAYRLALLMGSILSVALDPMTPSELKDLAAGVKSVP